MSSTVPKKDSLHFLSDYYFDTKSPAPFTSPLAFLTFHQIKTWLHPKIPTPYINQFDIIFRLIATEFDGQWQPDLVDINSLARFNKGYKILLT